MIFWLTETTLFMSPLALAICILVGVAVGWTLYGLRGYDYWYNRFHRYRYRSYRRPMRVRRSHGYVEYPPELTQTPAPSRRTEQIVRDQFQETEVIIPRTTKDDLEVIEGIGPKIAAILNEQGIYTWRELAQTPATNLKKILENAGKQYAIHDPSTWPKQAQMADTGYWDELKEYQDLLFGGRKEKKTAE